MPASVSPMTTTPARQRATIPGRRRRKPVRLAPITARDAAFDVAEKRVADPYEPGSFRYTPFNRRVDLLEEEISHKRITVSQYEIGRQIQAVFERASGARLGSGGWSQGGSRDQTIAHELAIIYAIDDARIIRGLVERVTRTLGQIDARLLRRILAERMTFAEAAAFQGKSGDRGARYIAARFRDALESLDDAFAARGLTQRDEEGLPVIRGEAALPSDEETDARGVTVPTGRGETWGTDQVRYGAEMSDEAFEIAAQGTPKVDRVSGRRRARQVGE